MKLKIKEVYNLNEGLTVLMDKDIPTIPAFKIQRNSHKIIEELKITERTREKLIEKYKDKELEDGKVKIKEDKLEEFNEEFTKLMEQEIEVDISKISIEDLVDIKIKPITLSLLSPMIKES